jgi:hypothetical protein
MYYRQMAVFHYSGQVVLFGDWELIITQFQYAGG